MDLNAEDFFRALCQDMTERGTTSRELVALEFDPESGDISVLYQPSEGLTLFPLARPALL